MYEQGSSTACGNTKGASSLWQFRTSRPSSMAATSAILSSESNFRRQWRRFPPLRLEPRWPRATAHDQRTRIGIARLRELQPTRLIRTGRGPKYDRLFRKLGTSPIFWVKQWSDWIVWVEPVAMLVTFMSTILLHYPSISHFDDAVEALPEKPLVL